MKKIDLYEYFGIKRKSNSKGYLEYVAGQGNVSVVVCPGGGYRHLSNSEKHAVAEKYASAGFKTYVLHYSIFPMRFPYSYLELVAAIDYLRKEDRGNKIVIVGFSAGGHLTLLGATLFNKPLAKDALYIAQKTPFDYRTLRPDAVIACYPVVSYAPKLRHSGSFKALCGRKKTLRRALSVDKLVDEETCPIFMWHTKEDTAVPYENSVVMKKNLDDYNIKNELVLFDKGGHGLSLGNDKYPETRIWFDKSIDFINSI